MSSDRHELRIALFEDGTHVVLRTDKGKPRHFELIATFYEPAHARDYIQSQAVPSEEPHKVVGGNSTIEQTTPDVRKQASAVHAKQSPKTKKPQLSAAGHKPALEVAPKHAADVPAAAPTEVKAKPAAAAQVKSAKPENVAGEISDRQAAVLKALDTLKDKRNRVEVKAADLAKASEVPLGSIHSIITSLEKKHLVRTERQGSPKFSAIYEVLKASRKGGRALNGAVTTKMAS